MNALAPNRYQMVVARPQVAEALAAIKSLVLNTVRSPHTRRSYDRALTGFLAWCSSGEGAAFTKATVQAYRSELEARGLSASGVNVQLAAIKKLAAEAADNGPLAPGTRCRRTVPVPGWVKVWLDEWTTEAGVTEGCVFRAINKGGRVYGDGLTANVIWSIVQGVRGRDGRAELAPHDLRRTCAKLCRAAGGDLEQIQLLLGHASIATTERYLGSRLDLVKAVNDDLGLNVI